MSDESVVDEVIRTHINVMHFNVQGMNGKLCELESILDEKAVDILCVSEHWEVDDMNDFVFGDYQIISCFCRKEKIRGGVCVVAKKSLNLKRIECKRSLEKDFEICCAHFTQHTREDFVVCAIYRSPSGDFTKFMESLEDTIEGLLRGSRRSLILSGDFNVELRPEFAEKNGNRLRDFLREFNIKQTIFEPTRRTQNTESCIDNIFTDARCHAARVFDSFLSDHTYQIAEIEVEVSQQCSNKPFKYRSYSKQNTSAFKNLISQIDWDSLINDDAQNANQSFERFNAVLLDNFNESFPFVTSKKKNNLRSNTYELSAELRELSKLVREMSIINRQIQCENYNLRFQAIKKVYIDRLTYEKKNYNNLRIIESDNVSRECWTIINKSRKSRRDSSKLGEIVDIEGRIITGREEVCNAFNDYFADLASCAGSPGLENAFSQIEDAAQSMFLFPTTPEEVHRTIREVCRKNSCGIDGMPGRILLEVSDFVSFPLSVLINKSFSDGIYPECLKHSKITPVFKNKGSRRNIENYRPIAVQCQLGRVFEKLFNIRLTSYLERFKLLSEYQNGFRRGFSTETAIARAVDCLHDNLNKKQRTLGLFFDLSRAFDTVDHSLLLYKVEKIGVRGSAYNWLKSYLTNRTARVVVDGVESRDRQISRGTPQGSCISPTLFNIFINALPEALYRHGTPIIYADDTNIILSAPTQSQLLTKSDEAIRTMLDWCRASGLLLNSTKTVAVEFTTKNRTLDRSLLVRLEGRSIINAMSSRFLGVCLDQKFTWSPHICGILPRLSSCCFLIKSIRGTVSVEVLRFVYFGLFQSIMTYGLIFWGSARESSQVFIVQKRAVRCMSGVTRRTSCKPYFKQLCLLTLPCLYIYTLILYVKRIGYETKRRDIHSHEVRSRERLQVPFDRLTVTQHNPKHIGIKITNHLKYLNAALFSITSEHKFKTVLKTFLIERCYYTLEEFFSDGVRVR